MKRTSRRPVRPVTVALPVSDVPLARERGNIGVWAVIRSLASMAVIFIGLLMLIAVLSVAFAIGR